MRRNSHWKHIVLTCLLVSLFISPFMPAAAPVAEDINLLIEDNEAVFIPLTATDDGLPDPPGMLTYVIVSLPQTGRLFDPGYGDILETPYVLLNENREVGYQPCSYIVQGTDSFGFYADDGGTDPNGVSNAAQVTLALDMSSSAAVGTGTFDNYYLFYTQYKNVRAQIFYYPDEIGPQYLTDLALDVTTIPPTTLSHCTIRLKETPLSSFGLIPAFQEDGWTLVYDANETITETGWHNFHFNTPFHYTGGSNNLLVEFAFHNDAKSGTNGRFRITNRTMPVFTSRVAYEYYDTTSPSTGHTSNKVPNLQIKGLANLPQPLSADLNLDCRVNMEDLQNMAGEWGSVLSLTSDLADDAVVDIADWAAFAQHWMERACGTCGGADFTGDGSVDLLDLETIAGEWLLTEAAGSADIDGDGAVGLGDLAELAGQWLRDGFIDN